MLFDDTYKKLLEDLDTSFSQLYKYVNSTASATQQGPTRYGNIPDGFKGGKDGMNPSLVDGRIFPQKKNLTRKEIKKRNKHKKDEMTKKVLLKNLRDKKYSK